MCPSWKNCSPAPPFEAPKLWLDPEVTSFYDFTPDSIRLEGYQYHPLGEKIPVAI